MEHAPAMWHCMFPMHVLIEVSRILEGTSAPRGMVIEVRFVPPGPSAEERKKTNKEKIQRKIKSLASR